MASQTREEESDDGMDEFMEKFKTHKYQNAFNESNWEEEFDKVPMFMKSAPEYIDPIKHPDLACLQSIIHDDDRPPEGTPHLTACCFHPLNLWEVGSAGSGQTQPPGPFGFAAREQAKSLKDEGNEYFKEKNYEKAIVSYTAGLKKNSAGLDLNAILYTNRAAAHFHLGNMRSALNDATAAQKLKPGHVKAIIRGAQCCLELHNYAGALQWCDEGLRVQPTDKKLQELRATADKQKRAAERDARKSKAKEKKQQNERGALLAAIKERGIKLLKAEKALHRSSDGEDDDGDERSTAAVAELSLDGLSSQEATGAQVYLDEQGALHWPVLFLYPEHRQTDFISAFCENSSFIDHLAVMFGDELPPWDTDRKYQPHNLQLFFEEHENGNLYEVDLEASLLNVLQRPGCSVKAGSPSFIILVKGSPFHKQFLSGKKVH